MTSRAALLAGLLVLATPRVESTSAHSGLDPSTFDPSIRPQDDLYRFVNGGWLKATGMPSDRVTYGAFTELTEKAENDLRIIIEEMAASRPRMGSPQQQIADLYASVMDERRVDALGAAPMAPVLAKINSARSPTELAAAAGHLSYLGAGGPFPTTVVTDASETTRLIVQVSQGGTLLPNRDYYLRGEQQFADVRSQYLAYLTTIFELVGYDDPAGTAHGVLAVETALARNQLPPTESRQAARSPRGATLNELMSQMAGFDWKAWARPQGIDKADAVALLQPTFFSAFATLIQKFPLDHLKGWLAARYITATAPYSSEPFVTARFDFFGRVLTGQDAPRARWKVGVSLVNAFLGDALGRRYVAKHLPSKARTKVETLVATVIKANRQAVDEADWLSPSTRAEALTKLSRIAARIGHPDQWRDYSGLVITRDDLAGNVQRARRFDSDYRMSRIAGAQPGEWLTTTPQTVNAYYNPALNEIVLPAAMLQPPLFDMDADDAVNYGALGATIGHELAHALDERGRRYDARGNVRRWWTIAEEAEHGRRAQQLVRQYGAYRPLHDLSLNGELTLGENLGDLVGLSIALRAYRLSLGDRPAPVVDGLSGEQRFFLAWARMWRMKVRDDYLREWVLTFPYAPYEYRANGVVSNLAAFHEAFSVTSRDRLFRAIDERVKIW